MENANDKISIVDTHEAYAGWTKMLIATVRLPDGHTLKREIEDHGEAVCVLPYNPVRKTAVLVRQWRAPVLYAAEGRSRSKPSPAASKTNRPTCAHREAMEEALLKLDSLEHVFTAWTMPGLSTELMHFYLASLFRRGAAGNARRCGRGRRYRRCRVCACRPGADGRCQCAARHQDAACCCRPCGCAGPICSDRFMSH